MAGKIYRSGTSWVASKVRHPKLRRQTNLDSRQVGKGSKADSMLLDSRRLVGNMPVDSTQVAGILEEVVGDVHSLDRSLGDVRSLAHALEEEVVGDVRSLDRQGHLVHPVPLVKILFHR
jgi:hypothetical protein